jgi:hypothetical protein
LSCYASFATDIPRLFDEKPERGCPELKNLLLEIRTRAGFVNQKIIIKSMMVVSPKVNANPRTPPTEKT